MAYTPDNNPYIPGDPYSYDLKWMVDEINASKNIRSIAENAAASADADAKAAEAWAVGTVEGEPVDPDAPQYENSAKYHADEAADSASSAADDAADAHADMLSAKSYADNIADPVSGLVTTWLTDHITNPSNPPIDTSLSVASAAADAKVVGDVIAAQYDATATYAVGDYVLYNGVLYKCNTAITTAEAWTAAHWTQVVAMDEVDQIFSDLASKYVGIRSYLSSADDMFALDPGSYGIPSAAANKPANMPADFTTTRNGYVVVFQTESASTKFALCAEAYDKKLWLRSGYDWVQLAKVPDTTAEINSAVDTVYNKFYTYFWPDWMHVASRFYGIGNSISTTNTQFKFLDPNGYEDIANTYTDWYASNEITIDPMAFYYVTASARSANHHLYQILDADGNILAYETATSWTIVSITNKLIYTPPQAAKIRIASVTGSAGIALKDSASGGVWSGKKWACMGDSLTAVNSTASVKYHDLIAEKTGIEVVNLGAGGTGYKKDYNGVDGFYNRTGDIPLDSDVVTIFGSGNDGSLTLGSPSDTGTTTVCGCINTTIDRIFQRITTCKLGIITPTPWQSYDPSDDTNWMARYSAAIVQICKNWGIPCLDLYHCSNLRPWDATFRSTAYYNSDGVHPNNTGHEIFAAAIENFLESLLLH